MVKAEPGASEREADVIQALDEDLHGAALEHAAQVEEGVPGRDELAGGELFRDGGERFLQLLFPGGIERDDVLDL